MAVENHKLEQDSRRRTHHADWLNSYVSDVWLNVIDTESLLNQYGAYHRFVNRALPYVRGGTPIWMPVGKLAAKAQDIVDAIKLNRNRRECQANKIRPDQENREGHPPRPPALWPSQRVEASPPFPPSPATSK